MTGPIYGPEERAFLSLFAEPYMGKTYAESPRYKILSLCFEAFTGLATGYYIRSGLALVLGDGEVRAFSLSVLADVEVQPTEGEP